MAKPSGDRDSDHWLEVCGIFALLLLYAATNLQEGQIAFLANRRGRGLPGYPLVGNNDGEGKWKDLGDALAMPSTSGDLRISPNIDPKGQYNVRLVDQPPAIQEPVQNIDADNVAAAEADLIMWLAVAEVASLPRQIEREEANMIRRPQVPSSVVESGTAPSSLLAAGAPQHLPPQSPVPEAVAADAPLPEAIGILAGVLPQQIEDENKALAEAQGEAEVDMEDFPPIMLELISDVAGLPGGLPQFAAASMTLPAGGLESNLQERMPVDHPEAGDSPADLQAEENIQPRAKGTQ